MGKTSIEWTEESWNPIGGCRKVSPGCKNCYAIRQARRMQGSPIVKIATRYQGITVEGPNWSGATFIDDDVLREPLKRRKPTTYFISLSDLFYDRRPDEDIDRVFAVMALCPQHRFLILTKYHERMGAYVGEMEPWSPRVIAIRQATSRYASFALDKAAPISFPLPNVGLGVSVEDQQHADERIPVLLQTPAAMRFVSAEPLLGSVSLRPYLDGHEEAGTPFDGAPHVGGCASYTPPVDWVIVGGESGPGARPCDVAWVRWIKGQCQSAHVPVFVKQLGRIPGDAFYEMGVRRLADPKGGEMSEWPADLQVRETPEWLGSRTGEAHAPDGAGASNSQEATS